MHAHRGRGAGAVVHAVGRYEMPASLLDTGLLGLARRLVDGRLELIKELVDVEEVALRP